jgi:hypothetical protein
MLYGLHEKIAVNVKILTSLFWRMHMFWASPNTKSVCWNADYLFVCLFIFIVTNLLKALRNSGHVVTQQVTSYNNRVSVYNTLLSSRQRTNEIPGWLWRVRDATIEQTSQAVFSAGPLGALGRLYKWTNQAESSTLTNDRPVLSSERAPHIDRTATFMQK